MLLELGTPRPNRPGYVFVQHIPYEIPQLDVEVLREVTCIKLVGISAGYRCADGMKSVNITVVCENLVRSRFFFSNDRSAGK